MVIPGAPSLLFLSYLFLVMPWLAIKSGRRIKEVLRSQGIDDRNLRNTVWYSTLLSESIMLVFAWIVGHGFGFRIFAVPKPTANALLASTISLVIVFAIRAILRKWRSVEEHSDLLAYALAPRSVREWQLVMLTVVVASIAEEAAYRGVAMSIVLYATQNSPFSMLVCSLAFALVHWVQGYKSMMAIFFIAIAMHILVVWTGCLVYAMVVHVVYDVVAIVLIWREAQQRQGFMTTR